MHRQNGCRLHYLRDFWAYCVMCTVLVQHTEVCCLQNVGFESIQSMYHDCNKFCTSIYGYGGKLTDIEAMLPRDGQREAVCHVIYGYGGKPMDTEAMLLKDGQTKTSSYHLSPHK